VTSLRATTIPSHGLQTLSSSPEVNGSLEVKGIPEGNSGWERNGGPEGEWCSGGELRPRPLFCGLMASFFHFN